jgi:hypothetical protein
MVNQLMLTDIAAKKESSIRYATTLPVLCLKNSLYLLKLVTL